MDEIAYKFYPKGISVLENEQYLKSDANIRLMAKIRDEESFQKIKKAVNPAIKKIEGILETEMVNHTNFSFLDRGYNFQFLLYSKENIKHILCLNISVLINIYTVYVIRLNIKEFKEGYNMYIPTRDEALETELYSNELKLVDTLIAQNTNFKKQTFEDLERVIEGIGFQHIEIGNFTYFNAFFLDQIITPFC